MNDSQLLHLVLFILAGVFYRRLPMWAYLGAAALLIELDQARNFGEPTFWHWFALLDTWLDLAADAAGIGLVYAVEALFRCSELGTCAANHERGYFCTLEAGHKGEHCAQGIAGNVIVKW